MKRLVNEKTLELNITHEIMNILGISVLGFTQREESRFGADVLFPLETPFVIQYKATRRGIDGNSAKFTINNNKRKNQHIVLDLISRSGTCGACYFFPLIISDQYLTFNFGNLINQTIYIDASAITGTLNWVNETHIIDVYNNGVFYVSSNEGNSGEGINARSFILSLKEEISNKKETDLNFYEYVVTVTENIEKIVRDENIYGISEHTFLFFGKNIEDDSLGYIQIPIQIHGMDKEKREEKRLEYYYRL